MTLAICTCSVWSTQGQVLQSLASHRMVEDMVTEGQAEAMAGREGLHSLSNLVALT